MTTSFLLSVLSRNNLFYFIWKQNLKRRAQVAAMSTKRPMGLAVAVVKLSRKENKTIQNRVSFPG